MKTFSYCDIMQYDEKIFLYIEPILFNLFYILN